MPELGRPILSSIVWSSFAGNLTVEFGFDLVESRAVSSTRRPGRARTCRRNSPASTCGKKSCPRRRAARARQAEQQEAGHEDAAVLQNGFQQRLIVAAEALEARSKPRWKRPRNVFGPAARCSWPRMMYMTRVGISVRESR